MRTYKANSQFKMLITLIIIVIGIIYLNSKLNFLKIVNSPDQQSVQSTNIVKITNSSNEIKTVTVEIANTENLRQQGLMNRTYLGESNGMLFTFDSNTQSGFWMKNTLIALDLIYIDENNKIVDIKENFIPCTTVDCPIYISKLPFKNVLEVNGGWSLKNNVKVGNSVEISTYGT